MYVSYQRSFFDSKRLKIWSEAYCLVLPEDTKVIYSSGSSGCSIASGMLLTSKTPLEHVYIRKPIDNKHHGENYIEKLNCNHYVIVDDLISSGQTIINILKKIKHVFSTTTKITIIVGHCSNKDFHDEAFKEFNIIPEVIEVEKLGIINET